MKIIAIGKIKEKWIQEGINEYLKRLPKLKIIEIKDSKSDDENYKEYLSLESVFHTNDRIFLQHWRCYGIWWEFNRHMELECFTNNWCIIDTSMAFTKNI